VTLVHTNKTPGNVTEGKLDLGGTLRARDAASTLAWIRPLLPHFGVTRVANITGLDRIGIPVWICIHPNGRSLSVSQGKGVTPELAQVSAVMESIECHHSEHVRPPDLVASHRTVRRRHEVVAPRQLQPGIRWKAYDDSRPIAWIRGSDLASGAGRARAARASRSRLEPRPPRLGGCSWSRARGWPPVTSARRLCAMRSSRSSSATPSGAGTACRRGHKTPRSCVRSRSKGPASPFVGPFR
jgi:hypothetical protein